MTILADASVIVAMVTREPDALSLADALCRHDDRLCCAVGMWEAALAVARKRTVSAVEAIDAIDRLLGDFQVRVVPVGEAEARVAIEAHDRFGKGTGHPARLNMGDCLAYACAKASGAELLYKGSDFAQTDLA